MDERQERKARIISLFDNAAQDKTSSSLINKIKGSHNALGDSNIIINGNVTVQAEHHKEPEFITTSQGYEIQQLIYKLADLDVTCGYSYGDLGQARRKWWNILRTHFKTTSYKYLKYAEYDNVIAYLHHHLEKLEADLVKVTTPGWRNKYYKAIYARCNERNITKPMLYQMADHYLDARIDSLKQLTDTDLKHLYHFMMEP